MASRRFSCLGVVDVSDFYRRVPSKRFDTNMTTTRDNVLGVGHSVEKEQFRHLSFLGQFHQHFRCSFRVGSFTLVFYRWHKCETWRVRGIKGFNSRFTYVCCTFLPNIKHMCIMHRNVWFQKNCFQ
jgi:hypothetical protein